MKKLYPLMLLMVGLFLSTAAKADNITLSRLRCEMLEQPVGMDVTHPRFSWELGSTSRGTMQVAYQLLVAASPEELKRGHGTVWNSGRITSDQSVLVRYAGKPLQSRQTYYWSVRVWTSKGESTWSVPAQFSMGLLKTSDWKAKWIGLDRAFSWDSVSKFARLSARYFRKEVSLSKTVRKATVYISGLGLYELYLNGQKVGDQVLAPAPTDYSKTVLYNSFDVTSMLRSGKNALGVTLGNGRFFAMRQQYKPQKWHTFGFPKLLLQLELEFADGTRQTIISDASWKVTADGPIRTNNEYDGEEYDATKELTGWNQPGYSDRSWLKVQLVRAPGGVLRAQLNGNMKVKQTLKPVSIKPLSPRVYIMDVGQNMAGWIHFNVKGKRGDTVKLRFAESLQADGSLYLANLRDALVTDLYILKGSERESWSPRFVYHGFRYVEITGYPGTPTAEDFTAEVVYDDLETIGSLQTSDSTINQIHRNAYWGILSNYKGMPVDCPQRNERQPWLGDRTMGAYGESFLFDNGRLYAKWLQDISDAQTKEGSIPDVAPSFWFYYKDNMTWPGAYLTIADMLYRQFGDREPIARHYASMKKWMGYMKKKYLTAEFIMTKDSYGDWCVPPESPELIHSRDSSRKTDPKLIATAYYYYLLQLMQRFAALSQHDEDIPIYVAEAARVKQAFNKKFYQPATATYSNNTVTANILPLAFRMVPEGDSLRVFNSITQKIIVENKGHISTGVIGTQWLMRWLTKYGRADLAMRMASNTTYPSWGYMVRNGATTIWELWNGNTANPAMNSQNHVMLLGDLLIWMYENLGGIQSDAEATAFKKIHMQPSFDTELMQASARYRSPHGWITSSWKKQNEELTWQVEVPQNTKATLYLPAASAESIFEGGKPHGNQEGIRFLRMENGKAVLEIGGGTYVFTSKNYRSADKAYHKN